MAVMRLVLDQLPQEPPGLERGDGALVGRPDLGVGDVDQLRRPLAVHLHPP